MLCMGVLPVDVIRGGASNSHACKGFLVLVDRLEPIISTVEPKVATGHISLCFQKAFLLKTKAFQKASLAAGASRPPGRTLRLGLESPKPFWAGPFWAGPLWAGALLAGPL